MKKRIMAGLAALLLVVGMAGTPFENRSAVMASTASVAARQAVQYRNRPKNSYWNYSKTNLVRVDVFKVTAMNINGYCYIRYDKIAYYNNGGRTWSNTGCDIVYAGRY